MRFMCRCARLPKGEEQLLKNINSAAERLFNKLKSYNVNAADISDFIKRYFGHKMTCIPANLKLNAYLLALSLAKSGIPIDKFVFLDYGGGSGMLSLLAKELGIGTVIYNDINPVCCHDAEEIAKSVGNKADYYICGDIDDVIAFLKGKNINCNAISSYDTLEHIYDIESFLEKLQFLSSNTLTVAVASGANTFNPLINRRWTKRQLSLEYEDQKRILGWDERDCSRAFLNVRKDIILEYLRSLNRKLDDDKVEQLARNTRGMVKAGIQKSLDDYLKTGKLPQEPSHPTNTCDPYTGNWAEHLMDLNNLVRILSNTGFKAELLAGYYSGSLSGSLKNIIKRYMGGFLNIVIRLSKKHGIRVSPCFVIYGTKII
jgi:2-polyprenyl-3-methyl-5-hydroxy-6-metoxy-1,4-benzoquinol methylase